MNRRVPIRADAVREHQMTPSSARTAPTTYAAVMSDIRSGRARGNGARSVAKPPAAYSGRFGEVALHRGVGELLEVYERQGHLLAWPVPNGAMLAGSDPVQRARRATRMKADRQLRPGVLDWCVLMKGGLLMLLEIKVGRNKLTPEQSAFAGTAERMGALVYEIRSITDAADAVNLAKLRRIA